MLCPYHIYRKWLPNSCSCVLWPCILMYTKCYMRKKINKYMQTTKLNSSRTGKCQCQLTVISAPFISLFLSSHSNICSDRHRSKWATLHWKKASAMWKIHRAELNLFGYSKLPLSLFWPTPCNMFSSCHSKPGSFECKIRCKSENLHLQDSFNWGSRGTKAHSF